MSNIKKILFIDRDGTLIFEPQDTFQIDSLEKLEILPGAISALQKLKKAGFYFVMVTNQDDLGSSNFPQNTFDIPQKKMMQIFNNEGISFEEVFVCPHTQEVNCNCRKPKTGLLDDYIKNSHIDLQNSYVIGDRESDMQLAKNLKIQGIQVDTNLEKSPSWEEVANILTQRKASLQRKTKETDISINMNIDGIGKSKIDTGIPFFDHMLEQIAKHGEIDLELSCKGDLEVDEHHSIEDCGIALGEAFASALGNKKGIERYGFLLPMDESLAQVAIDFSGRTHCTFACNFDREMLGAMPTEMISHFFQSFAEGAKCTLNIQCSGENNHHKAEACFKGFARTLKQAKQRNFDNMELPSSKGVL